MHNVHGGGVTELSRSLDFYEKQQINTVMPRGSRTFVALITYPFVKRSQFSVANVREQGKLGCLSNVRDEKLILVRNFVNHTGWRANIFKRILYLHTKRCGFSVDIAEGGAKNIVCFFCKEAAKSPPIRIQNTVTTRITTMLLVGMIVIERMYSRNSHGTRTKTIFTACKPTKTPLFSRTYPEEDVDLRVLSAEPKSPGEKIRSFLVKHVQMFRKEPDLWEGTRFAGSVDPVGTLQSITRFS